MKDISVKKQSGMKSIPIRKIPLEDLKFDLEHEYFQYFEKHCCLQIAKENINQTLYSITGYTGYMKSTKLAPSLNYMYPGDYITRKYDVFGTLRWKHSELPTSIYDLWLKKRIRKPTLYHYKHKRENERRRG